LISPLAEDSLQTLKAAGTGEAFPVALRAAKPPESASAQKPINQAQVITVLAAQIPSHRVQFLFSESSLNRCTGGVYC
jgi:hypothetical protein